MDCVADYLNFKEADCLEQYGRREEIMIFEVPEEEEDGP